MKQFVFLMLLMFTGVSFGAVGLESDLIKKDSVELSFVDSGVVSVDTLIMNDDFVYSSNPCLNFKQHEDFQEVKHEIERLKAELYHNESRKKRKKWIYSFMNFGFNFFNSITS